MNEEKKSTIPAASREAVELTDDALNEVAGGIEAIAIAPLKKNPQQKFQIGQPVRLASGAKFTCIYCEQSTIKDYGTISEATYVPGDYKAWEGYWSYYVHCPKCSSKSMRGELGSDNNKWTFDEDQLTQA